MKNIIDNLIRTKGYWQRELEQEESNIKGLLSSIERCHFNMAKNRSDIADITEAIKKLQT
jgi:hypothetical protein